MSYSVYHILHLIFVLLLTGVTFAAFAAPNPENRKKILMHSGIASLIVLVSGFGLLAKIKVGFPVWVILKVVCWLALSAFAGIAFRKPEKIKDLTIATIAAIVVAVLMVDLKPF